MPITNKQRRAEYNKTYYQKNRDKFLDKAAARYSEDKVYFYQKNKLQRKRIREFIDEYKKQLKCIRCGFSDYRALVFHHPSSAEKDFGIAQAYARGWSTDRIKQEMEKCQVLCANCHLIVHSED